MKKNEHFNEEQSLHLQDIKFKIEAGAESKVLVSHWYSILLGFFNFMPDFLHIFSNSYDTEYIVFVLINKFIKLIFIVVSY